MGLDASNDGCAGVVETWCAVVGKLPLLFAFSSIGLAVPLVPDGTSDDVHGNDMSVETRRDRRTRSVLRIDGGAREK